MATAARGWHGFRVYLEMIKIEHSIFALPFAMIGMIWGSLDRFGRVFPTWSIFAWVLVAMVSCRSAAMAFNRVADRRIDALNPRTSLRAIPAGLITLGTANTYFWASIAVFVLAAAMLNPLTLALSPIALLVTLGYSLTKRFTPFCHLILGLSLGIAPAAAYIAVTGVLHPAILAVVGAVLCWTAGFDVIYSLQDEDFDRENGLRSLPETYGRSRSLMASRILHFGAIVLLVIAGQLAGAGTIWFVGTLFAAALLTYEQSLVRPSDLSRVNLAFFTLNGMVSIGLFGFALTEALGRSS